MLFREDRGSKSNIFVLETFGLGFDRLNLVDTFSLNDVLALSTSLHTTSANFSIKKRLQIFELPQTLE